MSEEKKPTLKPTNFLPGDSYFNKEYRLRFEYYFDNRFCDRPPQKADLHTSITSFAKALGFRFDQSLRGIGETQTFVETTHRMFCFIHSEKERNNRKLSPEDSQLIVYLAAAAFLFDFGYDDTFSYAQKEKEYFHVYKTNMNRIRIYAKELFTAMALRFDQFLNLEAMNPIVWSVLEKRAERERRKTPTLPPPVRREASRNSAQTHRAGNELSGTPATHAVHEQRTLVHVGGF